jgi:hypothetical protein
VNYRTLVKHACLALLLLPSLASAEPIVGDVHAGMSGFAVGGDAAPASGAGLFADGEVGVREGHFDLTGFAAYATHRVDATFDDGSGTNNNDGHYRMHILDLGARATLRGKYLYGGVGLAFEDEIDDGTMKSPAGTMQVSGSDQHVAGELRIGAIVQHIDVSGSLTLASAFGDSLATFRVGAGYRF